jgi:hypothetical protein
MIPATPSESLRGGPKEADDADILRRLVERKARTLFLNAQSAGSGEIYHVILVRSDASCCR